MVPILSRAQIQELDRLMIHQAKVPSLVLMENAGRGAAELILRHRNNQARHALVLCGTGNNGGDGFVVARHLKSAGCTVRVVALGAPDLLSRDAEQMAEAWLGIGGHLRWIADSLQLVHLREALSNCSLVVDALFGTGLSKPLSGIHSEAVEILCQSAVPCCALDIPSGLDADTGSIIGNAVHAELTIAFAYPKLGHFSTQASECVGELYTASLGIPGDSWEKVGGFARRVESSDIEHWLPKRAASIHKGTAGKVAVIAGSPGTSGAALLAAHGALRAGAGLVTHVGYRATIDAIESRVLEAMTRRIDPEHIGEQLREVLSSANSVVIGPGLGVTAEAHQLLKITLELACVPVVVDADALSLLAHLPNVAKGPEGKRILTPHVGELARLLNTDIASIEADRFAALSKVVAQTNAIVVLKGAHTLIGAPDRTPVVVGSPCPSLATGGSGDVLAGMIGALAAVMEPWCAALCAVYWHNLAAKRWTDFHKADRGILAHEIADALPDAFAELSQGVVGMSE
jgi:NAD(P)H-hydrate epimerase